MDLETRLADPAFDLIVPADGLARVQQRAAQIRRRRRLAAVVPTVAAVALAVPFVMGGSRHPSATLYGSNGPSPAPTLGWAPASQQLQTFCLLPPGGPFDGSTDLIGPTGDPIDNCARFWRHARHTDPPALIAYQDQYGQVHVQVKSDPLPEGAKALPAGAVQNAEAIQLDEALGDPIGLGPDHCRDEQAALSDAQRVVVTLGLRNWPVRVDESRKNPALAQCWGSSAYMKDHVVRVVAVDGDLDFSPVLEQIAKPLRASLTHCWSRATALDEVRSAIAGSSLSTEFKDLADIREVDTPGARCTVVHLNGGGNVIVTLRGPA